MHDILDELNLFGAQFIRPGTSALPDQECRELYSDVHQCWRVPDSELMAEEWVSLAW
ncbi:hypothetical protein [Streptomyces sp. S.PB5]|uniref:hypothetical protein n=1 Tax=Streptomyces sp. S.PB5 TaxID=3020844 RepID=UPI0025AEF04F|nr:hypothetical protein [Streptomyces sp. S.PB5]MDN3026015.1 hypothetical protein [Streptomyces sp. S.PB5]